MSASLRCASSAQRRAFSSTERFSRLSISLPAKRARAFGSNLRASDSSSSRLIMRVYTKSDENVRATIIPSFSYFRQMLHENRKIRCRAWFLYLRVLLSSWARVQQMHDEGDAIAYDAALRHFAVVLEEHRITPSMLIHWLMALWGPCVVPQSSRKLSAAPSSVAIECRSHSTSERPWRNPRGKRVISFDPPSHAPSSESIWRAPDRHSDVLTRQSVPVAQCARVPPPSRLWSCSRSLYISSA